MFLCTVVLLMDTICAMLILCQNNKGKLHLCFYFTHLHPYFLLFLLCVTLAVLFLFYGASIFCVYNFLRASELVLDFPIGDICLYTPFASKLPFRAIKTLQLNIYFDPYKLKKKQQILFKK